MCESFGLYSTHGAGWEDVRVSKGVFGLSISQMYVEAGRLNWNLSEKAAANWVLISKFQAIFVTGRYKRRHFKVIEVSGFK